MRSTLPPSLPPPVLPRARESRDRGFTLIEVLVVVIIAGVLAAIAIPIYLNQRQKAVQSSLKADLRQVRTLLQAHTMDGGASGAPCFSATDCSQPGYVTDRLINAPLNMKFSPGNTVGDFWGGGTNSTFHVCLEHHVDGQPQEWIAYDTYGAGFDMGQGTTGGCPWTAVNVR